jgi:hypothetical protein
MSNIIVGNGGRGYAAAATAITVALILILMASPVILMTTEAFAASKSNNNKDCKGIEFLTSERGDTMTIGTSQDEYSVKLDMVRSEGSDGVAYIKNVAAEDPRGRVLLPEGETITITVQTSEYLPEEDDIAIIVFNHKVSDCQILTRSGFVNGDDKMALQIVSIEQTLGSRIAKLTVQVPDASDVDKHFTKLRISFPFSPEAQEYYLISHRVQVS